MKICFLTTGDIKDIATAKRALGMANPLSDLGYQVYILLQNSDENRKRVAMECDSRVTVHFFSKERTLAEILAKNTFLNQIRPDFLYLCGFVIRNIPFFYLKKTIILTEHSELQSGISDVKGMKRVFTLLLEYFSIIKSDGLLQASKYLQKEYRRRAKRIGVKRTDFYFPYAFNRDLYKPIEKEKLSESFQAYSATFNFVFLGTITKNYGAFTMLEAFQKLTERFDNIKLILLGKGRHYKEALEFIKINKLEDRVHLPGFVEEEDISDYFSIANAFISPMNDTVQDWARCPSKLYMYLPF